MIIYNFSFSLFLSFLLYDFQKKNRNHQKSRLEVTYANNNTLIKKFESLPTPEPVENGKKSNGKKSVGIKKVLAEKSKGLMSGAKGKEVVNTDAYF